MLTQSQVSKFTYTRIITRRKSFCELFTKKFPSKKNEQKNIRKTKSKILLNKETL